MSATDEDVVQKLFDASRVLKGLPSTSFRSIVQSQESLSQLHSLIAGTAFVAKAVEMPNKTPMLEMNESINPVPILLGFAGTALLHLQQQPILEAPAADLAAITQICDSLATAVQLPSSTPAMANRAKQQMLDSRTGAQEVPASGSANAELHVH
jgi:hypothetical protein